MRGVFQTEPKSPATFPKLNATRFSVRTEIPGNVPQFAREAFPGEIPGNMSRFKCEVFFRPEPIFLAIFPNMNARCVSGRTEIPGGIY